MSSFFPREVIQWRDQRLHPLRAFSLRTVELAGITGVVMRVFRAIVFTEAMSKNVVVLVFGVAIGVLFFCGMLTWHLGNFPIRRWPLRATAFWIIEGVAELGSSSALIALKREPLGSGIASWHDWWPLAGQTLVTHALIVLIYSLILAACVQIVRRTLDRKRLAEPVHTSS
ncbi:MAG: hypothetical protein ABJC26_04220 [Gemmatimonadaceae bacterium]